MKNLDLGIEFWVSRAFQPVPSTVFHVEFEFAAQNIPTLQPSEKNWVQKIQKINSKIPIILGIPKNS